MGRQIRSKFPSRILLVLLINIPWLYANRQVLVVTSTEEHFDATPKVIEVFDFVTKSWRAVEKSIAPLQLDEARNQRTSILKRPGTARLV